MVPKIIIHGGFFSESSQSESTKLAKQKALERIVLRSNEYLKSHTALQTVCYAVELLENDDLFNAGTGSQIQSDGKIRMSASVMDGLSKKFSGVINIEQVKNPIRVAEKLFAYDDRVLGGEGATSFARINGFACFDPEIPQRRRNSWMCSY
jgi:L-asparaginase